MSEYIIKITYENKDNDIVFYSTKGICFHDLEVAFNKFAIKGSYKRLISAEMIDYNQKTTLISRTERMLSNALNMKVSYCPVSKDFIYLVSRGEGITLTVDYLVENRFYDLAIILVNHYRRITEVK